jgi:hypothetical protein
VQQRTGQADPSVVDEAAEGSRAKRVCDLSCSAFDRALVPQVEQKRGKGATYLPREIDAILFERTLPNTRQPFLAACMAMARPIPLDVPVTTRAGAACWAGMASSILARWDDTRPRDASLDVVKPMVRVGGGRCNPAAVLTPTFR